MICTALLAATLASEPMGWNHYSRDDVTMSGLTDDGIPIVVDATCQMFKVQSLYYDWKYPNYDRQLYEEPIWVWMSADMRDDMRDQLRYLPQDCNCYLPGEK